MLHPHTERRESIPAGGREGPGILEGGRMPPWGIGTLGNRLRSLAGQQGKRETWVEPQAQPAFTPPGEGHAMPGAPQCAQVHRRAL